MIVASFQEEKGEQAAHNENVDSELSICKHLVTRLSITAMQTNASVA